MLDQQLSPRLSQYHQHGLVGLTDRWPPAEGEVESKFGVHELLFVSCLAFVWKEGTTVNASFSSCNARTCSLRHTSRHPNNDNSCTNTIQLQKEKLRAAMSRVTAVRVSCSGEAHKRDKVKEFCAYSIPDTHEVFTHGELSQFSALMGIPLLVLVVRPSMLQAKRRRYNERDSPIRSQPAHMYGYKEADKYYPNHVAAAFMAGNADGQEYWSATVGAVLFARTDKQPLETSHLHVMLGLLNEVTLAASTRSIPAAMNMLTPESFKAYYAASVDSLKALNEGEEWCDRSPWDDVTSSVAPAEYMYESEDEEL